MPAQLVEGLALRLAEEFGEPRPRRPGRYALIAGAGSLLVLGFLLIVMTLLGLVV